MAMTPQTSGTVPSGPSLDEAFLADRALFWHRFTSFAKGAIIAVVILLILLWIFLV